MASDIPRRAMGLAPLRLEPGLPVDQVLALDGPELARVALPTAP